MNVLNCVNALSCEASWSEPTGQGRALLQSKQLQQQRSSSPLTVMDLLLYRVSSRCTLPGLQSLHKCALRGTCRLYTHETTTFWPIFILSSASLRVSSREQDGHTFAPTTLCSPLRAVGVSVSQPAREIEFHP